MYVVFVRRRLHFLFLFFGGGQGLGFYMREKRDVTRGPIDELGRFEFVCLIRVCMLCSIWYKMWTAAV